MEKVKNKTNCPNCGAALPQFGGKCEFCGTRVVDLTAIDFDCADPTMFILRMPKYLSGDQGQILISMWARPILESISMETTTTDVYGGWNNYKMCEIPNYEAAFQMNLRPCADPNDHSMFKLEFDK